MRGQVSRALVSPVLHEMPVEDALLTWAHSYRDAAIAAPEAMVMLATSPIDADEGSFADYEQIARLLAADGWPTDTIVDAIVALESFIIGSALDALAPADNMLRAPSLALVPHLRRGRGRPRAAQHGLPAPAHVRDRRARPHPRTHRMGTREHHVGWSGGIPCAADDYLKTVYAHTEWQDAPITPSVLAAKLGIAPSSVTEMVKKLAGRRTRVARALRWRCD